MHIRDFAKKSQYYKNGWFNLKSQENGHPLQSLAMNTQIIYETSDTSIIFLNYYGRHDIAIADTAQIIIKQMRPLAPLNIAGIIV